MKVSLSAAAGALAGLIASIVLLKPKADRVDVIRWRDLIEWFTRRGRVKDAGPDVVGFTLLRRPAPVERAERLPRISTEERSSAPVLLIQGLFNQRTKTVVAFRAIEADGMDPEVTEAHAQNELVIYE